MMPLMMRRSSSRSGPVSPVGKCGWIRAHGLSFSQNKPAGILSPPNQEHVGKRITWRYLGTDPSKLVATDNDSFQPTVVVCPQPCMRIGKVVPRKWPKLHIVENG